jgi:GNAT superfamily N-acetyltransferase
MKPPEPLAAHHGLDNFECTRPVLNTWLKTRARINETYGASRTFVICEEANTEVIGYYCLSQGAIGHNQVSSKFRRNMPDPIPVTLLGRLAVDQRFSGKGFGAAFLQDAVLRARHAATIVASRGMIVHALDDDAALFYGRYGFVGAPKVPLLMVLGFG